MPNLEALSWSQLVDELRDLTKVAPTTKANDDPSAALHNLLVHQVELEMQNRALRDAQERLETSRARYADLFDFAPVGYLTLLPDGHIEEINLTGSALLARDRRDLVGRPLVDVMGLEGSPDALHEALRRCFEDRMRGATEVEIAPPGKPNVVLHVTTAPLVDDAGAVGTCRITLTDITDRKRAEQAEHERERAKDEARIKEEFLGIVSHELRTPLNAILGWAHILLECDDERGRDPALVKRAVEVIARNAHQQTRIIDDILDVSRILAGKLRIEPVLLELEPLVRSTVENMRHAATAKGIALSVTIDEGALLFGDTDRLSQVFGNLLNNALKFTNSGGAVAVHMSKESNAVRISVRDNGRGIAREDLPHVFERFRQVDGSVARATGGLGLGLSIVEHIVRAHGGDVTAASDGLGRGATFVVRLRTSKATGPLEARPPPPPSGAFARSLEIVTGTAVLAGTKVLCVEDDADALELLVHVLEEQGASVTAARSTAAAIEALATSIPDVLLSDIGLPGANGYTLMRRVRVLPGHASRVAGIAMSAYAGEGTKQHALDAGFDAFLAKPITPAMLVDAVARIAKNRASVRK